MVAVGVPSPVPVTVTLAVAVAVDAPAARAYDTVIVQLPATTGGTAAGFAGARPVPLAQVPPVTENVPAGVPTGVIVGAAVNVNAPAVAPAAVFVTVIVPVAVPVLAGVGLSAGVGGLNASVAPVIVNVSAGALVFAPGLPALVTVIFLVPGKTPEARLKLTVRVFGPTHVVVTVPRPVKPVTVVPVWLKLVPVRVTATACAALPAAVRVTDAGLRAVSVGAGGTVTVNATVFVVPIGVTTAMVLPPAVAVGAMLIRAVTVVPHEGAGAPAGHGSAT